MLILGIDTAAAPCCAAVYDTEKGQILGSTVINNKLTHSVTLMPVVRDLVRNAELSMEDIGLFAVANGPGSFTGLRIGISAVKGLAFALSKPCAAVSTLEAMAYNVTAYDCVVCAAMDARCNQVYVALFRVNGGKVERLTEEECKELHKKLVAYVEKEKPYINPDLKMGDLASALDTSSHSLSYLLNQYLNQSYYDFINEYRVTQFKKMVADSQYSRYTLTALAELCGFSSRASFFRSFKKSTGVTPNEYIRSIGGTAKEE